MSILRVSNLYKKYPVFELCDVSFELEQGKITGFIGRNGAGKSTTLKGIFNVVHPDKGEVVFFDKEFSDNELDIKQRVGFVSGGVDYYPKKKIKVITAVTKCFYKKWDDAAYQKYMTMFKLDENKTPSQLSAGMKVKYALTLALSHNADLLILDEPTSGLDPISRDELLEVFMELCDSGITILFSTHITSDLDKCADNIIYIKDGKIQAEDTLKSFVDGYRLAEFNKDELTEEKKRWLTGCKRSKNGFTALLKSEDAQESKIKCTNTDIEAIMVHLEREEER